MYVLDTSALVDAWNKWYSPVSHAGFWVNLEELAQNQEATMPDAALLELERQDDDLYRWCKDREEFLWTQSIEPIQEIVNQVSNNYQNMMNVGIPSKNYADPVVIAVASYYACAVVTHENATGNPSGPKLPDVCKAMNIRVMQMHHLVREQGWIFT